MRIFDPVVSLWRAITWFFENVFDAFFCNEYESEPVPEPDLSEARFHDDPKPVHLAPRKRSRKKTQVKKLARKKKATPQKSSKKKASR